MPGEIEIQKGGEGGGGGGGGGGACRLFTCLAMPTQTSGLPKIP